MSTAADVRRDDDLLGWLTSAENPPVRYLASRDLLPVRPGAAKLARLRSGILGWEPLRQVLSLQRPDGSFAASGSPADARRTFWGLLLMRRCGLQTSDEPVSRVLEHLTGRHRVAGALSYTTGGSGVLPCYLGVVTAALVKMGALDSNLVQGSVQWLVDHQRFDHGTTRAGGAEPWPYRAPHNYGCWQSVSCYHGVAGAIRAFAAIPPERRSAQVKARLEEGIEYLRIHRLYRRTTTGTPLFRHLTQTFLLGDYRSDLLDMLGAVADADPALVREPWVRSAVADMEALTEEGRVTLVKNYGHSLMASIPLETVGEPSRFLTYDWLLVRRAFATAARPSPVRQRRS